VLQGSIKGYDVTTPRTEDLKEISPVLGVCNVTSKERKRERSEELELSTGCHARARSGDADVTTYDDKSFCCWKHPGYNVRRSNPSYAQ
jgi:hypothetical protein